MAYSFQEILRNDGNLMKLLSIVDRHSQAENGLISIKDITDICAQIATINTLNPKTHTRRIAWTLTGRLLLGLTTQYDIRVQICFEESQRLNSTLGRYSFVVERTKTTKRKIKHVTTNSKTKKRRTVEIEVEEENVEHVRFWEEPLVLEPNLKLPRDSCLVPAENITLHEIEVPLMDNDNYELDEFNSFGEECQDFSIDDEMPAFDFRTSLELDENMNENIMAPEIEQESSFPDMAEQLLLKKASDSKTTEQLTKNTPSLIKNLSSLQLSAVATLKKTKRKSSLVFMDTETALPSVLMRRRISNVLVNCKKRTSITIRNQQPLQKLKSKKVDMFSVPVMNGTINRGMFARNAITKETHTDWKIIQDAFEPSDCDVSNGIDGSRVSNEFEILRNESESQIRTRNQSFANSNELSFAEASHVSTPFRPFSSQNFRSSTPLIQVTNEKSISHYNNEHSLALEDLISPPLNYKDQSSRFQEHSGQITPPNQFGDSNQSSFMQPNVTKRLSSFHLADEQSVPEIDSISHKLIECPDLITLLGENSLEYVTISKLVGLWQQNIHPIRVEHLLTARCNRFQAAKTFSSLLQLKKKKMVQLENDEDGKITHISKGDDLKLD